MLRSEHRPKGGGWVTLVAVLVSINLQMQYVACGLTFKVINFHFYGVYNV